MTKRERLRKAAWRNYRRCCAAAVKAVGAGDLRRACRHTINADKWYLKHDALLRLGPGRRG